jgi:hypothetical protein
MKYIFVVGAPGSKWSSVVKNIYFSPDIDRSDYSEDRKYAHHAGVMHIGAYFDPGMEFGKEFDRIDQFSRTHNELEFNKPFNGSGIRIIKSHVLSHHIDYLKKAWTDCPVVLVHRENDACLGWWVRCGHFNIQYPNYQYYENLEKMAQHIDAQNADIVSAWNTHTGKLPANNIELAEMLQIASPPEEYYQDYKKSDINVMII